MVGITLDDRIHAIRVQTTIERLLALDVVWTRSLDRCEPLRQEQIGSLHSVAEEMRRLLSDCERDSAWLLKFYDDHQDELAALWKQAVAKAVREDSQKALLSRVEQKGGFPALGQLASKIPEITRSESTAVAKKMRQILANGHAPGDLSQNAKCFLKGGLAVVALAAEPLFGAYIALEVADECF